MSLEAGLFRDPDGKEQIPFPPYLRKDELCAALVKGFPPPVQVCGKSAVVGERILASKTQGHSSREIASILGLRSIASFHCPFSPLE